MPANLVPTRLRGPARAIYLFRYLAAFVALAFVVHNFASFARTVAVFAATLGVLVFVHEWGHYQFARWAGMKVNRFALGFPPFIFNREKNGVIYSIGALPIGGMVDIAGLGSEEEMVNTAKGEAVAPQRDLARPFGEKQYQDGSLFWRFMVIFAGPLMNFLLAIVIFVGVFSVAGLPVPSFKAQIQSVLPGGVAEKAGLKAKDEILAVGGKKTADPNALSAAIQGGKGQPTTLSVLREGKTLQVPITPVVRDLLGDGKKVPSIGIAFDPNAIRSFSYIKLSPVDAVKQGFYSSLSISLNILDTIKRLVSRKLSSDEAKSIGGPVKIAQTVGQASQFGWPIALNFAAMLSVNLGLMNLLPLPALDGGRILFLGYEFVVRRPFNPRWEGLVHAAGMILLLAFMLFITLRDVASL